MNEAKLRQLALDNMRYFIGAVYGDAKWKEIIDVYNNECRCQYNKDKWGTRTNIAMQVGYGWCATTTSVAGQKAGLNNVIPIEMGVDELYNIAVRNHIWQAKGNGYGCQPADLIVFKWNTGNPAKPVQWHIGMIESVSGDNLVTIEGNVDDPRQCERRNRRKDEATLFGYISPLYCTIATDDPEEPDEPEAKSKAEEILESMEIGDTLEKVDSGEFILRHEEKTKYTL